MLAGVLCALLIISEVLYIRSSILTVRAGSEHDNFESYAKVDEDENDFAQEDESKKVETEKDNEKISQRESEENNFGDSGSINSSVMKGPSEDNNGENQNSIQENHASGTDAESEENGGNEVYVKAGKDENDAAHKDGSSEAETENEEISQEESDENNFEGIGSADGTVTEEQPEGNDGENQNFIQENHVSEMDVEDEEKSESEVMPENSGEIETNADSSNYIARGISNDIVWVIDENGKLTVTGMGDLLDGDSAWKEYKESIISAEIKVTYVTDTSRWFSGCSNLESLDLANLNTSNVTNMGLMFSGCNSLKNLDVSNFDTSNVTNMKGMFWDCNQLESLDLSSFNTRNVIDMSDMFRICSKLESLDLNSFSTGNAANMGHMFFDCKRLKSLDLSSFNTEKVTDMNAMFQNCIKLENLDLGNFNTENVTDMSAMFRNCENLENLDLSIFNTENVTDMRDMFNECKKLTELNLGNFNTSRVTSMFYMFAGCNNLSSLDLSNFITKDVVNMQYMFYDCHNLTDLDLGSFDTRNVTVMDRMFNGCSKLTDLDLSSFDVGRVTYAFGIFDHCDSLTTIYTPRNLTVSVSLPTETWYRSDETVVMELPENLNYSVTLGKNYVPEEREVEIEGITINKTEIATMVAPDKNKSYLRVFDGKTGEGVVDARVNVNNTLYITNEMGIVPLDLSGEMKIRIEKEGYESREATKTLEKGVITQAGLLPDAGEIQVLSAVLQSEVGEEKDVLNGITYVVHQNLDNVMNGYDTKFTLRVQSAGQPRRYQLIQDNKGIQESWDGVFELSGKCVNHKDGSVSYYIEDLKAGYEVYVKVYDNKGRFYKQELGIRVSEGSDSLYMSLPQYMKEEEGITKDWKIDLKDKLEITVPGSIPIFGNSEFNFGFESPVPFVIDMNDNGKVRLAINMKGLSDDSEAWKAMKEEYKSLADKAVKAWNEEADSQPFGAGLVSVDADIMGYGEGYWDDIANNLRIDVGVIVKVNIDIDYTKYYYIVVPVYITFGCGMACTATGELQLTYENGNIVLGGGSLDIEPSLYVKLNGGVGAEGILSIGAYGKLSLDWLHRFSNDYDRVSLGGDAKIVAKAFKYWEKTLAELDGSWTLYDSNRRMAVYADRSIDSGISCWDMSDAELVPMDYLIRREEEAEIVPYSMERAEPSDSTCILRHSFESASPCIKRVEDKLYLFYLDGVEGRKAQNQTALFYRISSDDGRTWSEAQRVDNGANETADFDFDVAVKGKDIYVIWSDAGSVYGDELLETDSLEAIAKIGKEMNLMMSVIDGGTGVVKDTRSLATADADLQPQIAIEPNGTVYTAWITNDVSAEEGVFSNKNQINICYASSKDNYAIKQLELAEGLYPLTIDMGMLGSQINVVTDLDTDGDLYTQNDRELYIAKIDEGKELSVLTSNNVTDSVPRFGKVVGENCLLWYQNGNIACTVNGQDVNLVFDEDKLPSMGQEFFLLEGSSGETSIVWTATSLEERTNVDVYCTDFDGSGWSEAFRLGELESEYTTQLSGYRNGSDYRMVYVGSSYEERDCLYSHLYMYTPEERVDTAITWYGEENEVPGETYPIHLLVTNNGNKEVSSLSIASLEGNIRDTIIGLSIAPGTSQEVIWNGIRLPEEMKEIYACNLTIMAQGEINAEDNVIDLSIGETDLSVEAYSDYSNGERFASVTVKNNGILSSDAILTVYKDKAHTEELYRTDLPGMVGGETRIVVFDLTVMEDTAQTFYFAVSDGKGTERYMTDNESLIYTGKGILHEEENRPVKPSYITAEKMRTSYEYGDNLNVDDITVTLYYSDGTSQNIDGYITNVSDIDMHTVGMKCLTVTYNEMEATLDLMIEPRTLDERTEILLPYESCDYDGTAKEPAPTVLINGVELVEGSDYVVIWSNNVNAGKGIISITGKNNYQGTIVRNFIIRKTDSSGDGGDEKEDGGNKGAENGGSGNISSNGSGEEGGGSGNIGSNGSGKGNDERTVKDNGGHSGSEGIRERENVSGSARGGDGGVKDKDQEPGSWEMQDEQAEIIQPNSDLNDMEQNKAVSEASEWNLIPIVVIGTVAISVASGILFIILKKKKEKEEMG